MTITLQHTQYNIVENPIN